MICPKCGTEMTKGAGWICSKCGGKFYEDSGFSNVTLLCSKCGGGVDCLLVLTRPKANEKDPSPITRCDKSSDGFAYWEEI